MTRTVARLVDRAEFGGAMNVGHIVRKGHELDAVALSTDGGRLWSVTIRRCCGDVVPDGVEWVD